MLATQRKRAPLRATPARTRPARATLACCRPVRVHCTHTPLHPPQMPAASDLAKLCRTVEQAEGNSYVHCANGHGRSTMLVAMIMIRRGDRYT